MATKYECDKCKCEVTLAGKKEVFIEGIGYDICNTCMVSLYAWLDKK